MSNVSYHHIRSNESGVLDNVVALFPDRDKPIRQADSKHPHWQRIIDGLANNDESVYDLFDVQVGIVRQMTALSDRVSYDGSHILFDGDVQSGPLADHLLRCIESSVQDYAPVVKFWEKVAQNPDERSREQLFTWLQSHDFTVTEDGDILGYKGVRVVDDGFTSINTSGVAFVDGVEKKGAIPNPLGAVITMPRSEVKNDPNVACHKGLHVGDWSYASGFARGAVLEVHVNPRDVVSIPNDSSFKKMRCCRYKVVKVRTEQHEGPVSFEDEEAWAGDVGYAVE